MFKSRKYKSGTIWCFWRWTDVDSEYITRLHVVKTPWWAICVHWINKPDPEPYLHDHPVSFLSVILRGGYSEKVGIGILSDPWEHVFKIERRNWFNWVPSSHKHTICAVDPNTVTLCFMGPKTREWGFTTPDGWKFWKDYYAEKRTRK
jgi:hypothetical protein